MNFEGFICVWVSAESIQIHDTEGVVSFTDQGEMPYEFFGIEGISEPKGYTY